MKLLKESKLLANVMLNNIDLHYVETNDTTFELLSDLYNHLLHAYNVVKKRPPIKEIKRSIRGNVIKPKMFNAKSFPTNIIEHIEKTSLVEISYSFLVYDRHVTVYFVVDADTDVTQCNRYIEAISIWLHMVNGYASKKCVHKLCIYLYFTSLLKTLPTSNDTVLDENHVNTAFTTSCPVDSEIVIFRKEEWFKVLIHESFHTFGLDFSEMNASTANKCILTIFPVDSTVNAYEAYSECWAELLNALMCGFFESSDKSNVYQVLSKTELYINVERRYALFQMVKTLDFMGLQYADLYSKTKYSAHLRENNYKENSNVLSYYVIKTILMYHFESFLEWSHTHNNNILDFKKSLANQSSFCQFIKHKYRTKDMITSIECFEMFLSKLKREKASKKKKFMLTTMRMTICELA